MADVVDDAQELVERQLADAIARARSATPRGVSAAVCALCGDEIPEARRRAVVTTMCVDCAEIEGRR